jgi:hypothetical protein
MLLVAMLQASAQNTLKVQAGAVIKTTGGAIITLQDMNLDNDGTINQAPGEGIFRFTGTADNTISGTSTSLFDIMEIAKTGAAKVTLLQHLNIGSAINFTSGLIDLNGENILLQPTALLNGESELSRITGTTGGYIEITNTLNAPASINPGNLGAILTSAANMGSTTIRRGHQSQVNAFGAGNSIFRYYDITPANNTGLNATLRFLYFDAELNGLTESVLTQWKSSNLTSWTNEGFTTRNTATNYVEKTGITNFSRWTLSTPGNVLPVTGFVLSGRWLNNGAQLRWKTETEINNHHFNVQRFYQNGQSPFSDIATVPTLHIGGNSVSTTWYDYTDAAVSAIQGSIFYRIQQVDIDNRFSFSNTIRISPDAILLFIDKVYPTIVESGLNIQTGNAPLEKMTISIHDMAGKLVLLKTVPYQSQLLSIPVISSGVYQLKIQSGQWEYKSSLIKQ